MVRPESKHRNNMRVQPLADPGGVNRVAGNPPNPPFWPDLFHQVKLSCRETARWRHLSGTYSSDEDIFRLQTRHIDTSSAVCFPVVQVCFSHPALSS